MIKIHPIYKDYGADEEGNVFSKCFHPTRNKTCEFKKLKPAVAKKGYLIFSIMSNNKRIGKYVHHFVYECITQTTPIWGQQSNSNTINHKNSIKTDNRFENLEMITLKENNLLKECFKQENKESGLPRFVYLNKIYLEKGWKTPYYVQILYKGSMKYFGSFETIEAAQLVAQAKRKELFPNE